MKRIRKPHGFTLIELIVVILILGILATIAVIGYTNITDKAQATQLTANATQIVNALAADSTAASESTVDGFLAKEALYGPDGVSGTADDYTDTAAYLAARFPGVTTSYATGAVTVTGTTQHIVINTTGAVPSAGSPVAN